MQLSIIIVNYNVCYFLEQALLSVRAAARSLQVETWVVDNNSVDNSVAMVREKFPEVRLIANTTNTGFAVANNQAIRQASGKYILLLNPDTVLKEDTLTRCYEFMETHPQAGGLGVKMIDGSGTYLPESKRGFPSPWVAFCKTVGLSRFFPTSSLFNGYYLGHLSPDTIQEVDVLAGAFMWMRRSALEKVGLLDEAFFMYGEDIDLSYRLQQGGYKNYYLPTTTIIHYKGESTKKGSLNYVKTFYQAMIIFAKKHFTGSQAWWFVQMLQVAIYLRAGITLLSHVAQRVAAPFTDAVVMFGSLYGLQNFWATHYFKDPDYYKANFLYINVPLYILLWVSSIYLSGGYASSRRIGQVAKGVWWGTVVLAALYGLLPLHLRNSRALIVLGAAGAVTGAIGWRLGWHFLRYRNFNITNTTAQNLLIVGSPEEAQRTLQLLQQAQVQKNLIGIVAPSEGAMRQDSLSHSGQLRELVSIYKVEELIFCSKDVPIHDIIYWMTTLGGGIDYKIIPQESLSIIGSHSKNAAGELYTIDISFQIDMPEQRRTKRLFDVLLAIGILVATPLFWWWRAYRQLWIAAPAVLWGRKTWIGYAHTDSYKTLPQLRHGVWTTLAGRYQQHRFADSTVQHVDFLYAKDYTAQRDMTLVWEGLLAGVE